MLLKSWWAAADLSHCNVWTTSAPPLPTRAIAPKIAPIVYIWSDPLILCCIILINVLFVRISVGAFATCDTNLKPEAA